MNPVTISNAADWHARQAMKAYRKRDYDTYVRHIREADLLRDVCMRVQVAMMEAA